MSTLALYGGTPIKMGSLTTGPRFGEEELAELREALAQNTLFYWHGGKVKQLQHEFAAMYGVKYCIAASSGTAAIHVALGALGLTCGDEVITSPITDMGTIIGILYQNAIPVFADVDPHTYNLDPRCVEAAITERTKAIVAVHLAGMPADMDAILSIARRHNLRVVEDCAQTYHARYHGRLVGTFGDFGCFSLNDYKQISAGEGGLILTNDGALAERAMLFADKGYARRSTGITPPEALAPNYRMNELTGAVALAQIRKLDSICARRRQIGTRYQDGLQDLKGISPHGTTPGGESTWWYYSFRVDPKILGVGRDKFVEAVKAEGIPCQGSHIPDVVYRYPVLANRHAYQGTDCPWGCPRRGRAVEYQSGLCPVAEEVIQQTVKLPISEFYSDADADAVVEAVRKVALFFATGRRQTAGLSKK